jgi:hypothetical protein
MQLDVLRFEHDIVAGPAAVAHDGSVERERRAFDACRQSAHARLREFPIDHRRRRTPRLGDFERTGEFGDQELRVVDLDGGEQRGQLELQCGRARKLEARPAAMHLEPKRIASDRL